MRSNGTPITSSCKKLTSLSIEVLDKQFLFFRPADLETLWDQLTDEEFALDERIPYWIEIWPASILLSQWLMTSKHLLCRRRCLELGCGLGLVSTVASLLGAKAYGLDYEFEALTHARLSASYNQVRPCWIQMDWRSPGFKPQSFDYLLGADILYEKRFFDPLITLLDNNLRPGGKAWLSTPNRPISKDFFSKVQTIGWKATILDFKKITYQGFQDMAIELWEVDPKS